MLSRVFLASRTQQVRQRARVRGPVHSRGSDRWPAERSHREREPVRDGIRQDFRRVGDDVRIRSESSMEYIVVVVIDGRSFFSAFK